MSVAALRDWRLPGCGDECYPRNHDPRAHELWGLLLATLTPPTRVIRTGTLTFDLDTRRATVNGVVVALGPNQEGYLAHLAERIGQWCRNADVLAAVWGLSSEHRIRALRQDGYHRYPDTAMVNTCRNRLRQKLGVAGRLIEVRSSPQVGSASRLVREEPS